MAGGAGGRGAGTMVVPGRVVEEPGAVVPPGREVELGTDELGTDELGLDDVGGTELGGRTGPSRSSRLPESHDGGALTGLQRATVPPGIST